MGPAPAGRVGTRRTCSCGTRTNAIVEHGTTRGAVSLDALDGVHQLLPKQHAGHAAVQPKQATLLYDGHKRLHRCAHVPVCLHAVRAHHRREASGEAGRENKQNNNSRKEKTQLCWCTSSVHDFDGVEGVSGHTLCHSRHHAGGHVANRRGRGRHGNTTGFKGVCVSINDSTQRVLVPGCGCRWCAPVFTPPQTAPRNWQRRSSKNKNKKRCSVCTSKSFQLGFGAIVTHSQHTHWRHREYIGRSLFQPIHVPRADNDKDNAACLRLWAVD